MVFNKSPLVLLWFPTDIECVSFGFQWRALGSQWVSNCLSFVLLEFPMGFLKCSTVVHRFPLEFQWCSFGFLWVSFGFQWNGVSLVDLNNFTRLRCFQ